LLLVMHGSWRFLYETQTKLLPNTIDASSTTDQQTCLSVGLVVKKYWIKLIHIFTMLQQHESYHKRSNCTAIIQSKSTNNPEKHCQTIETSFGPCSSCTKLQQCLRDFGDSIINLCLTYNLPSSLAHHRCSTTTVPEWLSSDDIIHWFESQSKDFDSLSKHLEYLHNTLNKTKNDLDLNEKHFKQQIETNRHLQQLINENKQSKKILQESYEKKIIELKKEHDQDKSNLNEQIKLLTTQKNDLEQQFSDLNNECISNREQIEKFEPTKSELKVLTENQIKSNDLIKTLEQDRIRSETELNVVKRDLEERNHELQKERIRIENMIRQEEHHQSKHKILTKSHEELSDECESLKKQVMEITIERDELQKSLKLIEKQNQASSNILMETNNHVLQEVASLKTNIEQMHQQINEREQILSKYSDINEHNQTILASDNLIHDMQNQMQTNELRIDLLRKQNDSLKSSLGNCLLKNNINNLSKITQESRDSTRHEESHRQDSLRNEIVTSKPKRTPLFLLDSEIDEQQQAFTETRPVTTTNTLPNYTNSRWIHSESIVNIETLSQQHPSSRTIGSTRIQSTNLGTIIESRPPPTTRSSRIIPSSSDHNIVTNKGRSTTSNRPSTTDHSRRDSLPTKSSRNISSAKTHSLALNIIHRCTNCNQTYDDKRNYDIHKLYCRT
ncbi:unnamed protein product, partial [Adineta steineri]